MCSCWSAVLLFNTAVSNLLSGSLYYLLIGLRRCVNTSNFWRTQDFGRSWKPSKKHMKSTCHKGSPWTLKQRPRGSQNGAQMVPKPPKNEIRILTRKATSKKTSKYQIRTLFAMFAVYPGPPKKHTFPSLFGDQNKPRSPSRRDLSNCLQKGDPFFPKIAEK